MKIEEKYSEITLDGAREMYSSIYNLDDNVTIGEIKQFMTERQEQLKKTKENENEHLEKMVGKCYSVSFTNLNTKPTNYIILVHIQQMDELNFICQKVEYYCGSIECKDDFMIHHDSFKNSEFQTVTEISKDDFDMVLEKYRDLSNSFLNYV